MKLLLNKKLLNLTFLLLLWSFASTAKETLDVVVGLSKPPYVFENNQQGYELDFIRAVLKSINKSPNFIFVPFGRSEKMLNSEGVDALLTANTRIIRDKSLLSDVYITYQNVAISLSKRALNINTINDLGAHSIAAFQTAHKILGQDFANITMVSPMYTQVSNQQAQLEMLFKERIDVIVMDINIFNYFLKAYQGVHTLDEVSIHPVFEPTLYRMAFKDSSIIPTFNQALATFKQSNELKQLEEKYGYHEQKPDKFVAKKLN